MKTKKAETSIRGWIIGLFLMILLMIVILSVIRGGVAPGAQGFMDFAKNIFSSAEKGDPIRNPCQCGWPTPDDYEQIEHEGITYCVANRGECLGERLASEMYKTIDFRVIQGADPVKLCVYTPSECFASKS